MQSLYDWWPAFIVSSDLVSSSDFCCTQKVFTLEPGDGAQYFWRSRRAELLRQHVAAFTTFSPALYAVVVLLSQCLTADFWYTLDPLTWGFLFFACTSSAFAR